MLAKKTIDVIKNDVQSMLDETKKNANKIVHECFLNQEVYYTTTVFSSDGLEHTKKHHGTIKDAVCVENSNEVLFTVEDKFGNDTLVFDRQVVNL